MDKKFAGQLLLVFLIYSIAGWVGIRYAGMGGSSLTLIWLPSGVGLSACLLFGTRIWPAIWFGSFAANTPFLFDASAQFPLLKAILFGAAAAVINTLIQSLFAHRLYQRYVGEGHFNSKRGVLEFSFRVALIPSFLNISLLSILYFSGGYMATQLADPNYNVVSNGLAGMLADFHGYFIVTPLAIAWCLKQNSTSQKLLAERSQTLGILAVVAFAGLLQLSMVVPQAVYAFAALGVLVAMGFGIRGASIFMAGLSLLLTFDTAQQVGPFVFATEWESFVSLLVFVFGLGLPIYLLAAEGSERREVLDHLEDQVESRTRELVQAKELAEEASRDKSRFLASASHDLRQPLHALNLQLEKLKHQSRNADENKDDNSFELVQESVANLNLLFNEILDISKLDSGGVETNLTSFPLKSLFDSLAREFQQKAESKNLLLEIEDGGVHLCSDFILLLRVIQNIVQNSIAYTDVGAVKLSCIEEGDKVCLIIEDSGRGIQEKELKNIFKEFYQVGNSARATKQGIGVGLSIASRICELLGHRLEIESEFGQFTRVKLWVPAAADSQDESSDKDEVFSISGAAILVVENELDILDATADLLSDWGCAAIKASTLEEALRCAENEEIDLLLCDYRLSEEHTGLEVAARVNQKLDFPAAVIIITGDTQPQLRKEILAAGYQYLHKPVTPKHLKRSLTSLMKARAGIEEQSASVEQA